MTDTMNETISLPVLVLKGICVLPNTMAGFTVGRPMSIAAVETAMNSNQTIFLTAQKDIKVSEPTIHDVYNIGVVAKIKQIAKMPDQTMRILIKSDGKARIITELNNSPEYLSAEVELIEDMTLDIDKDTNEAYLRLLKEQVERLQSVNNKISQEKLSFILGCNNINELVNDLSEYLEISYINKQRILEAKDVVSRFNILIEILANEIRVNIIKSSIKEKVQINVEKSQKEYILREEQKIISEELGDSSNIKTFIEYEDKADDLIASEEIKKAIKKEISKGKSMPSNSMEIGILKSYIETLLSLPWDKKSEDNNDLKNAKKILDEDHYGLDKVKERILEFLSVRILTGAKGNSTILCLVGPPGVGKTSIVKSVAKALNKKYIRMSLGGVRDEAEIRGHRRTYVGAMPGRIATGLKNAGTKNPLILLDEIDKIGSDYKGDPFAALLEVLDSEQNSIFRDNYVELPIDLSEVMFIATANDLNTIPRPLLDRMEIIEISSYTANEKNHIAYNHLIKKQIDLNGLKASQISITKKTLDDIIEGYTREAGVRSLERKISEICRKAARKIVEDKEEKVKVTTKNLEKFLGKPIFIKEESDDESLIGIVTGLAWTSVGGDTLEIEVNVMEGKGNIVLTGKLGDVMKESAQIGLSYVKSIASEYNILPIYFSEHDIHIHVPEGAVPKDGPSAGITMATAIVSAITLTPVKKHIAMTGEITLRGRVLPIGGLKEKMLAAKNYGIKTIIVPMANKRDVLEFSEEITSGLEIKYVNNMKSVLEYALEKR